MLKSTDDLKREIQNIFGTLKILVLFFCVIPVIQKLFTVNEGEEIIYYNISKMFVFCLFVLIVGVFSFLLNHAFKHNRIGTAVEVVSMYAFCFLCYYITGIHESNYKFIFAIIILIYSMELGLKFGLLFSIFSGSIVIVFDIVSCTEKMRSTYFQSDFMLLAAFILAAYIVGFYVEKDKMLIAKLNDSANRDSLTGLYNHRYFHEYIQGVLQDNNENCDQFLFMIDIDYFKVYNDTLGHQKGDAVLKKIAELCLENIPSGIVFRYGGEEFVVCLRAKDVEEVLRIANVLRLSIADYNFEGEQLMPGHNLTISVGVAERRNNDTAADWIERADNALYKAKAFRKNRVQLYTSVFERFDHLDQIDDDDRIVSIKTLLSVINSRDRYTYNHTDRVVHYCEAFAKYAKLSDDSARMLLYGAYLHDIGKINIPQEVLITEKKLTDEQWEQIKKHPGDGADIVRKVKNFELVASIVEQHHEKYDGSGYPFGLRGNDILFLARVLTLADSFDAMTAKRPYQKVKTFEEAFGEIRRCKGTHFDPDIAEMFIKAIKVTY